MHDLKAILKLLNGIYAGFDDFPSKALGALRDPSADPLLAAIILAIAATSLFLLSSFIELMIAIFFPVKGQKAIEELSGERRQNGHKEKSSRRRFVDRIVIAATVFAFLAALTFGSSQPRFCASCHEMAGFYENWSKSSHAEVGCTVCHQKAGLFGFAMAKVDLARMSLRKMAGGSEKSIGAVLEERTCKSCHRSIYTKKVVRGSIRVSHAEFLRAGYACADCHGTIGHGERFGAARPTMAKCAGCHDGHRASAECSACHAYDVGASAGRSLVDYPKAELPSGNCKGCHDIAKCTACHGVEMPHQLGWTPNGHAKAAAFEKKEICKKCHSESFCGNCHSFPGHPADWKNGHKTGRSAEKACMSCHTSDKSPFFCGLCHDDKEKINGSKD